MVRVLQREFHFIYLFIHTHERGSEIIRIKKKKKNKKKHNKTVGFEELVQFH